MAMAESSHFSSLIRTYGNPPGLFARSTLVDSLDHLGAAIGRQLLIVHGDPRSISSPHVARTAGADTVHIAADYGPYGSARDTAVQNALEAIDVRLVRTGSSYAVAAGRVTKQDGTAYRVFTPFYRAWLSHGWRAPAAEPPGDIDWWMPPGMRGAPDGRKHRDRPTRSGRGKRHGNDGRTSTPLACPPTTRAATDPISTAPAP